MLRRPVCFERAKFCEQAGDRDVVKSGYRKQVLAFFRLIYQADLLGDTGPEAVAALLMVGTIGGIILATFLNNVGGAWDNAKKYIEAGMLRVPTQGGGWEVLGKGSDAHKAAVVGDTVGDPFKDTSGPAMNILIKLMSIVSLIIAPLLANYTGLLLW